jgi:hypothetical protein
MYLLPNSSNWHLETERTSTEKAAIFSVSMFVRCEQLYAVCQTSDSLLIREHTQSIEHRRTRYRTKMSIGTMPSNNGTSYVPISLITPLTLLIIRVTPLYAGSPFLPPVVLDVRGY